MKLKLVSTLGGLAALLIVVTHSGGFRTSANASGGQLGGLYRSVTGTTKSKTGQG